MTAAHDIPFVGLESPFHIRPLRRIVDPVALDEPPHRHNFQEMLWVKSGRGRHKIDQTVLEIAPQTFYLISQGQVHYFMQGVDLEGFLIRFTDDFLLDYTIDGDWDYRMTLFGHFAIHRSLGVPDHFLPLVEMLLEQLYAEQRQSRFGRTAVLRHLLSTLLIQLERIRQEVGRNEAELPADAQVYQQFVVCLDQHYRLYHQVSDYAALLHLTPRQLTYITIQFTGKSAKQLIQERLLLEAKRYLQHTNASVKEIAYTLGFNDPSYFSKVFKQAAGVSPHEYKAELPEARG